MSEERLDGAIQLFLAAASSCPHYKTYELLGECYLRLERWVEAIPWLAAATTLNRQARAPSLLAEALLRHGDHERAIEAADIALSRSSGNRRAIKARQAASAAAKQGEEP